MSFFKTTLQFIGEGVMDFISDINQSEIPLIEESKIEDSSDSYYDEHFDYISFNNSNIRADESADYLPFKD